ncbi:Restriction endonuclease [Vibrio crassostreae]|nr:Restriction endonuclease [Vibrio crassostreae]
MKKRIGDIVSKVKSGMNRAYADTLNFTDDPAARFGAEYLFAVNVAKEIGRLNGPDADPYQIYIEASVKKVAKDCLPLIKRGNPMVRGSSIIRKGPPFMEREGRVDIAVYTDVMPYKCNGNTPFCIIELKSFNPTRKLVIKDLKRNLEFLTLSGPTGKSFVEVVLFSAVHTVAPTNDLAQLDKQVKKIQDDYSNWLSEVGNLAGIDTDIQTFTLSKDVEGRIMDDIDGYYVDTDSKHHFIGVIVIFTNKA